MVTDGDVQLPGGPRLAVRRWPGQLRPFLLVHGLASNARLWDGVARRLAEAGHEVLAVDQRGHGRSEQSAEGYDTATAAGDLAALIGELGWTGPRAPIAAGQSWGGNVVLALAASGGGVAGLALVDGGWIHLADRFPTFDECWAVLEPPRFGGLTRESLQRLSTSWHVDWPEEGRLGSLANFADLPDGKVRPHLTREHHRSIVHSLWQDGPRRLYARITVPTVVMAAVDVVPAHPTPVTEIGAQIADAQVLWYVGAHHDLHAQQPGRCAADLLTLARRVAAAEAGTQTA
ncbi:MAG: alpha/beta hydrolase [Candidatus Nanopelagicales bacterium]